MTTLLCALAFSLVPIHGPSLGYIFDESAGALRPILGIPGAASVGDPIDAGVPLHSAVVSPRQDIALATAGDDQHVLTISLAAGAAPTAQPLDGVPAAPDRIFFSAGGTTAGLYYRSDGTVRLVTGLPNAPIAGPSVNVAVAGGPITALAVSDTGAVLAAGGTDPSSVYLLLAGSDPRLLLSVRHAAGVTFLNHNSDVLIADDLDNKVHLVRDPAGQATAILLGDAESGIDGPVAVAASSDDQRAVVANSGSGAITTLDLGSGAANSIGCDCAPSGLVPMFGSTFRLTGMTSGPLWMLDGDGSDAHTFFVPAGSKAELQAAPSASEPPHLIPPPTGVHRKAGLR